MGSFIAIKEGPQAASPHDLKCSGRRSHGIAADLVAAALPPQGHCLHEDGHRMDALVEGPVDGDEGGCVAHNGERY